MLGGALEHQMFEEMGDAGRSRWLIRGPDLVPDHVGHDRRAPVRHHDDFQPVGEREVGRLVAGIACGGTCKKGRRSGDGEQRNGQKSVVQH